MRLEKGEGVTRVNAFPLLVCANVNGINVTIFIKLEHPALLLCAKKLNSRISNHERRSLESLLCIYIM